MWLDTHLDGQISPLDVLQVFNYMLRQQSATALGTPSAEPAASPAASNVEVATAFGTTSSDAVAFALSLNSVATPAPAAESSVAVDAVYAALEAASNDGLDDLVGVELLLPVGASVSTDASETDDEGSDDEAAWDWLG
jgi:hypothetical protein